MLNALVRRSLVLPVAAVAVAACAREVVAPSSASSVNAWADAAAPQGGTDETLAGALTLPAGTCPDTYTLVEVPIGTTQDANRNGYACQSMKGGLIDDIIPAGEPGTCPEGFALTEFPFPGLAPDENGNGWYCLSKTERMDDTIIEVQDGTKVNGHGNFFDKGKKALQDISFSYHAIPTGGKEFEAKGEFEFQDQTNRLRVHGTVMCAVIKGNTAFISGIVDKSNDPGLPEGQHVAWSTADNGEPGGGVDLSARPTPVKKGCVDQRGSKTIRIESGNVQVH